MGLDYVDTSVLLENTPPVKFMPNYMYIWDPSSTLVTCTIMTTSFFPFSLLFVNGNKMASDRFVAWRYELYCLGKIIAFTT